MKTKNAILFLFLVCWLNLSAAFTISRDAVVTIGSNTQMRISNMDLNNHGEFVGDTASLLIISSNRESKISGEDFCLFSLRVAGNVQLQVPTLWLVGDLIMQSGVLNIGSNRLIIEGDLLGENQQAFVTASTGTIETTISNIVAQRQVRALGLEFTPLESKYNSHIIRSHRPVFRFSGSSEYMSASRVFEFSSPKSITNIHLQTHPGERQHLTRHSLFVENFSGWQRIIEPNSVLQGVFRITEFAPDNLYFPKILTPNLPTNNLFVITGLDEFPNARLVILNRHGQVLYDLYPYNNDFDGQNLPTGTYYFMFSESRNNNPVKKSFFELVR